MIKYFFRFLELIYPVYYELKITSSDRSVKIYHDLDEESALRRYNDTEVKGSITLVTLDKYINIKGGYLIKCGYFHKGK